MRSMEMSAKTVEEAVQAACAALFPYLRQSHVYAKFAAGFFHRFDLRRGIGHKLIQRHYHRQAEGVLQRADMVQKIGQAPLQSGEILHA